MELVVTQIETSVYRLERFEINVNLLLLPVLRQNSAAVDLLGNNSPIIPVQFELNPLSVCRNCIYLKHNIIEVVLSADSENINVVL